MRRLMFLVGSVAGLSGIMAAAACSSDNGGTATDDGGADSGRDARRDGTPDPDTDGSVPLPDPSGTALVIGDTFIIGATTDNDIVFLAATSQTEADLVALPVGGGTATTIASKVSIANDSQVVRGNTVVYWSNTSTASVGTLNVWTKAGGSKTGLGTNSVAGFVGSNVAGTKLLFTANAVLANAKLSTADVGYLDIATAVSGTAVQPIITGEGAINLAAAVAPSATTSAPCPPNVRFGADTAYVAYCTGSVATEINARLVSLNGATVTRLDSTTSTGTVQPLLAVDPDGKTILTIGLDAAGAKVQIIKPPTPVGTILEDGKVDTGFVVSGGNAVIFHNDANKVLKYDTTGAAPTTKSQLVADAKPVKLIPRLSADQSKLVVSYNAPVSNSGVNLFDLHVITTMDPNQTPSDLVMTSSAFAFNFLADNKTLVYVDELSSSGGKMKSIPAAGGTPKVLQTGAAGARVPTATGSKGALAFVNGSMNAQTQDTLFDVSWSKDAANGVAAAPLETLIVPASVLFVGNKLVYQREGDPAKKGFGIFTIDLPQ